MSLGWLGVLLFAASFGGTAAVRHVALARQLLDIPNARSSHVVPTPRGGGVAIVAAFLLGVACLAVAGRIDAGAAVALGFGGLLVAAVGFIDDIRHVDSRVRLACHVVAAMTALVALGGVPPFPVLGFTIDIGWAAQALGVLYLVGLLNFFNFMDGIDGIAALEAISVALGGAFVWWLAVPDGHWPVAVLFAASAAGFLAWNLPPARIFMGDVGSGFLGFSVGALSLWAGLEHAPLFWAWFVLVGCFMVDATVTLVRRMRRGTRFDEAHRSHAYQYASRRWRSHLPVTLTYAGLTMLWLLPWAAAVAVGRVDGVLAVLVAYAPLVALAFRYKAGAPDLQDV